MKPFKYLKILCHSSVSGEIIQSATNNKRFTECLSKFTGLNVNPMNERMYKGVSDKLLEKKEMSGKEQDTYMRAKWVENRSDFVKNLNESIQSPMKDVLKIHKTKDTLTQYNTTWSVTIENPLGGHDQLNITFMKKTDALVEAFNTGFIMHAMTNAFPGMGIGISEEIYSKYISPYRGVDGTGDHPVYDSSLGQLISENARLAKLKNVYSDYYALGANSVIENGGVVNTFGNKDNSSKSVTMFARTTYAHVLQGNVPWHLTEIEGESDFYAMVSVHKGEHPVSVGDKVNIFIAPFTFFQMTRVAENFVNNFKSVEGEFGEEAYQFNHNGRVAAAFNQHLSSLIWLRHSLLGYGEVLAKPLAFMQMLGNVSVLFDRPTLVSATKDDASVEAALDKIKAEINSKGDHIKEGYQPLHDSLSEPEKTDINKAVNDAGGHKDGTEKNPLNISDSNVHEIKPPADQNKHLIDIPHGPGKDILQNDPFHHEPLPKQEPFKPVIDPVKKPTDGAKK